MSYSTVTAENFYTEKNLTNSNSPDPEIKTRTGTVSSHAYNHYTKASIHNAKHYNKYNTHKNSASAAVSTQSSSINAPALRYLDIFKIATT